MNQQLDCVGKKNFKNSQALNNGTVIVSETEGTCLATWLVTEVGYKPTAVQHISSVKTGQTLCINSNTRQSEERYQDNREDRSVRANL